MLLDLDNFKIKHNEVIMYSQLIENDLKWIYSYMHNGDQYENYSQLEKVPFGDIVRKLEELDNSDNSPYLSKEDYSFLKKMVRIRNYWCHDNYISFLYLDNYLNTMEYLDECNKLIKDHQKFSIVMQNVEDAKIKVINIYKR